MENLSTHRSSLKHGVISVSVRFLREPVRKATKPPYRNAAAMTVIGVTLRTRASRFPRAGLEPVETDKHERLFKYRGWVRAGRDGRRQIAEERPGARDNGKGK